MKNETRTEPFLEELLMNEMSRANTDRVAGIISRDPGRLKQAIDIVMKEEEPVSRRAMWAIDVACESKPGLASPYMAKLIDRLPHFKHDAFRRHILRIATRLPFQEETKGKLLSICFDFLTDSNQPIAVKAHALYILSRIAHDEPGIKHELTETINYLYENESPGFKSQAKKVLTKLNNL